MHDDSVRAKDLDYTGRVVFAVASQVVNIFRQ